MGFVDYCGASVTVSAIPWRRV